jgi:hypothetical protein
LSYVADDHANAVIELRRPARERQRVSVDAHRRLSFSGDAGRSEREDRPIIIGWDDVFIARDEVGNCRGHLRGDVIRRQTDYFQRVAHTSEVLVETKYLAAKCAQPFGHGRAHEKADVVDVDAEFAVGNPATV